MELLEQEREGPLEIGRDRAADVGGQIPHAPLEGPDRLLAALVVELLLGVPLLPLVLALRFHPLLELAPQVGRQLRVRSEERRVGKGCRSRRSPSHYWSAD